MKRVLFAYVAAVSPAFAEDLPLNPVITQSTIADAICKPGWTKTIWPPVRYTNRVKMELLRREELPTELTVDFALDHRIPLALGGAPSDPKNLQLQHGTRRRKRIKSSPVWRVSFALAQSPLDEARKRIWADWREAGKSCGR